MINGWGSWLGTYWIAYVLIDFLAYEGRFRCIFEGSASGMASGTSIVGGSVNSDAVNKHLECDPTLER
jgi:hypothetical protein